MARPKSDLVKVSLRLVEGDIDTLRKFYPAVDYNKVIRILVNKHCRLLQEKQSQAMAEGELTP